MTALDPDDVLRTVDALVSGEIDRESAASWASKYHLLPVADPVVEETLDALTLIDARHTDGNGQPLGYMYDFSELLQLRDSLTKSRPDTSERR